QAPGDPAVRHQYFGNAPLRQRLLEFTVWHGLDRLSRLPVVLQHEQQEDRDDPVADIPLIFLLHNRHPSRIESLRIGCEQTRQSIAQPDRKRATAALPGTYKDGPRARAPASMEPRNPLHEGAMSRRLGDSGRE